MDENKTLPQETPSVLPEASPPESAVQTDVTESVQSTTEDTAQKSAPEEQASDAPAKSKDAPDKSVSSKESTAQDGDAAAPQKPSNSDFKQKFWEPWLRPVVVLMSICIATSLLLGLTNMFTQPIIDENTKRTADLARSELITAADSFTEMEVPEGHKNATSMYVADNGTGYVIEAYGQGYGGQVPVMIAFDNDGTILGITFLANNETPGLGTKLVTEPWFAQQFIGGPAEVVSSSDIDTLASATISSNAALVAINSAIELFNETVLDSAAPENPAEMLLPGEALTEITLSGEDILPQGYVTDSGNYIIAAKSSGYQSDVTVYVAMDAEGVVLNIYADTSGEAGAATLGADDAFISQFIGISEPMQVDTIAGMSATSGAIKQAISTALDTLAQAKEVA